MRPNVMTRSIVSATVVAGLAIGTLAGAGTSFAASAPKAQPAVSAGAVSILATNNLGLTSKQAKGIQRWLKGWGYKGDIDGQLGTNSWKAMQTYLAKDWKYEDAIDGIVGPNTIKALQRFLKEHSNYEGAIDGIAGPGTRAAWSNWANFIYTD
ncbi:peptidoglycan-binding domain-containing protein [Streptomyces sp. NPDC012510]|jgi:peptidoglycan hydrolase-like protein with peptidoglycan-binding domain|uniref:peptidoglycan-binding domain-containing protein n=1 Tax=Streptomyces sp. NPDC012510 TaxID=3364838 RepID=UPI0036E345B7